MWRAQSLAPGDAREQVRPTPTEGNTTAFPGNQALPSRDMPVGVRGVLPRDVPFRAFPGGANSVLRSRLGGSNDCDWQHSRLGRGKNRVISAEVAKLSKVLGINLQGEYNTDVNDHTP